MRVTAGRALRVAPGDEVTILARLAHPSSTLGRLYVFAREGSDGEFSPYVPHLGDLVSGSRPQMHNPLSLRLTSGQPSRQLKFQADFEGQVRVMQEVDTPKDPVAKVKLKRKISPNIAWRERFSRKIRGILPW